MWWSYAGIDKSPFGWIAVFELRKPSFCVLALFCLVIQSNIAASHADIYLSNSGSQEWLGNCDDPRCLAQDAPCGFSSILIDAYTTGSSCNMVLINGSFGGASLKISSVAPLKLLIGRIDQLEIELSTTNSIEIRSTSKENTILASSSIRLNYLGNQLVSLNDISIVDLNLEETPIYIIKSFRMELLNVNLTWTSNSPSPIRFANHLPFLYLTSSYVNAPSVSLIDYPSMGRLGLTRSVLALDSLASLTTASLSEIFLTTSTVIYRSQVLVTAPQPLLGSIFSVNEGSRLIHSPRDDSSIDPSPIGASSINDGLGRIFDGKLSLVRVDRAFAFNVQLNTDEIVLQDAQLINCDVPSTNVFDCSNANFTISKSYSNLNINSSESAVVSVSGLRVNVSDSEASRRPFRISTANPAMETASISTNKLWLGSDLIIYQLNVTESIGKAEDGQRIPTLGAPNLGSSWYFHSVAVTSVAINMTLVGSLDYTISNPSKGVIFPAPGEISIPAVSFRNSSGRFLQVNLLPQSPPIRNGVWYPLFSNFTGPRIVLDFSPDVYLDHSLYIMETLVFGSVTPTLHFRRLPIGLPPTSENGVCPTPLPPGFECIDGVLVAIGNIDIPVIDFPPGSGVIIIIGNISSPSPISFSDTNSFLNVSGCIDIPGIEINLEGVKDPSTVLPSGSIVLASQGSECPKSLQNIPLSVKQNNKSCKKVKAKVDPQSTASVVSVLFTVDNTDCNVKWIILGSVLGAVVVILVILVLIFSLNKRARTCIRPFSARKPGDS